MHPSTGVYCIAVATGINPTYAVATLRDDDSAFGAQINVLPAATDCPNENAEVNTFQVILHGATNAAARGSGLRK
ncbi:MAG: hypothetical protein ACJ780_25535 [Solirubrobacteraceae bacterium]